MRVSGRLLAGLATICLAVSAGGCASSSPPAAELDAGFPSHVGLDGGENPSPDGGLPDAGPPPDCPGYRSDGGIDSYTALENLRGQALSDALNTRVRNHRSLGYDGAKEALFGSGGIEVIEGRVECVYTGKLFLPAELDQSQGYNVEHSWPQNEGADSAVPKSDLHHLFATDQVANSSRGSLPYGDTDCDVSYCRFREGGSEIGPRQGGTETVFEVRPLRRGDIARAHFYFSVRYRLPIPAVEEEALRRWNRCDPPDERERTRNARIEGLQHNRNPFVDRPEFVDYIGDF